MTFEGVPWMVDEAEHSAEVGRLLAYAATGGGEGVIGPSDCKVVASSIPDGNVHINSGGIAALNRFPGGGQQTYIARNVGDTVVALDPQGSSGARYDLVAVIVQDPEYAGQPEPVDQATGPYVKAVVYKNVGPTASTLAEVAPDQTGYVLARVKFDASDGTITAADITDLREMVQARNKRVLLQGEVLNNVASYGPGVYSTFGDYLPSVKVPEWATRVQIAATLNSIVTFGSHIGYFRLMLDTLTGVGTGFDIDANAGGQRDNFQAVFDGDVSALAGQTVPLILQAQGGHSANNEFANGYIGTTLRYDIFFTESVR